MSSSALPTFPARHVPLDHPGAPRMAGALELAAPLALGQRGLIVAPPRTGATTVLRWMGRAVRAAHPDAHVWAVLVDRPVEELAEWRDEVPGVHVLGTASDAGDPDVHAAVRHSFHEAAATAAAGSDVVVLVDSIASLARALAAGSEHAGDERVHDGGVPHSALLELRSLFGLARPGGTAGGSLTIIGSVQAGTAQHLDELVVHELVGTGNVEWHLDAEAMRAGLFPPVDIPASSARRTELVLGEAETHRRALLRAEVDARGAVAGLSTLLIELDGAGTLQAVLDDAEHRAHAADRARDRSQRDDPFGIDLPREETPVAPLISDPAEAAQLMDDLLGGAGD